MSVQRRIPRTFHEISKGAAMAAYRGPPLLIRPRLPTTTTDDGSGEAPEWFGRTASSSRSSGGCYCSWREQPSIAASKCSHWSSSNGSHREQLQKPQLLHQQRFAASFASPIAGILSEDDVISAAGGRRKQGEGSTGMRRSRRSSRWTGLHCSSQSAVNQWQQQQSRTASVQLGCFLSRAMQQHQPLRMQVPLRLQQPHRLGRGRNNPRFTAPSAASAAASAGGGGAATAAAAIAATGRGGGSVATSATVPALPPMSLAEDRATAEGEGPVAVCGEGWREEEEEGEAIGSGRIQRASLEVRGPPIVTGNLPQQMKEDELHGQKQVAVSPPSSVHSSTLSSFAAPYSTPSSSSRPSRPKPSAQHHALRQGIQQQQHQQQRQQEEGGQQQQQQQRRRRQGTVPVEVVDVSGEKDIFVVAQVASKAESVHFLAPLGIRRHLPLFVYLPGMDASGVFLYGQLEGLEPFFDVRCMAIPGNCTRTFEELAQITSGLIAHETNLRSSQSQNQVHHQQQQNKVEEKSEEKDEDTRTVIFSNVAVVNSTDSSTPSKGSSSRSQGGSTSSSHSSSSSSRRRRLRSQGPKDTEQDAEPSSPAAAEMTVTVMAESFGAGIAFALVKSFPCLVQRLVLANSASGFRRQPLLALTSSFLMPIASVLPPPPPLADLSSLALAPLLSAWDRLSDTSRRLITPPFSTEIVLPGTLNHRAWLMMELRPTDAQLKALRCKTLLVASARDSLMPSVEEAFGLASCIPNCQVHVLPLSGHVAFIEDGVSLHAILLEHNMLLAQDQAQAAQ